MQHDIPEKGNEPEASASGSEDFLRRHFPIYPSLDFDSTLFSKGWPIGISTNYEEDYLRRIAAGGVSYLIQAKSIDSIYKRSHSEVSFQKDEHRMDKRVSSVIDDMLKIFEQNHRRIGSRKTTCVGHFAFDLNMVRLPTTIRAALTLAHRGLLLEGKSLIRMGVEIVAWAWAVRNMEEDAIMRTQAQRAVSSLKNVYPTVGRIYGLLSHFAHWIPSEHHRIAKLDPNTNDVLVVSANTKFKAILLLYVLILLDIFLVVFENYYVSKDLNFTSIDVETKHILPCRPVKLIASELGNALPIEHDIQYGLTLLL